jgi:hypothetical protein
MYYSRAVDPSMAPTINDISTDQSSASQDTLAKCKMLLDYAATHPKSIIRYRASDMILHIDSDAAYLVQQNTHSRYAGHCLLSDNPPPPPTKPNPRPNGPVLTVCKTLRGITRSAAESETGGVFNDGQAAIMCWTALHALGHPQPPTPLKTDNTTASSFVHKNIRQRSSKTWDMRWNCLLTLRLWISETAILETKTTTLLPTTRNSLLLYSDGNGAAFQSYPEMNASSVSTSKNKYYYYFIDCGGAGVQQSIMRHPIE